VSEAAARSGYLAVPDEAERLERFRRGDPDWADIFQLPEDLAGRQAAALELDVWSFLLRRTRRWMTCADMAAYGIADEDGTYGRELFYEARGYSVTDCYNQKTDNTITGGYSSVNSKAQIAGTPSKHTRRGPSF
jgi:hypothetical protein